jgi:hypothetical protein
MRSPSSGCRRRGFGSSSVSRAGICASQLGAYRGTSPRPCRFAARAPATCERLHQQGTRFRGAVPLDALAARRTPVPSCETSPPASCRSGFAGGSRHRCPVDACSTPCAKRAARRRTDDVEAARRALEASMVSRARARRVR